MININITCIMLQARQTNLIPTDAYAGGAVPALAQLVSSSYHAAMSSSLLARSRAQDDGAHKARSSSPL